MAGVRAPCCPCFLLSFFLSVNRKTLASACVSYFLSSFLWILAGCERAGAHGCLLVCVSVHLSVRLALCPSVCCVCLPGCPCQPVCLSVLLAGWALSLKHPHTTPTPTPTLVKCRECVRARACSPRPSPCPRAPGAARARFRARPRARISGCALGSPRFAPLRRSAHWQSRRGRDGRAESAPGAPTRTWPASPSLHRRVYTEFTQK